MLAKLTMILFVAALITGFSAVSGFTDNQKSIVFPPDSKPYGLSYNEWSAKWWQWVLSIPANTNPMNDRTGQNCAVGQQGTVWFLVGTSGSVERTCTVPSGKGIFFIVLGGECSFNEYPNFKSASELSKCAVDSNNGGSNSLNAKVDGTPIQNLEKYRVQSQPFGVTYPSKPQFGSKSGPTTAVADGWYLMLHALSPGQHTIEFSGLHTPPPTTGSTTFVTQAVYHLTIR
jgi:hypothetical protein